MSKEHEDEDYLDEDKPYKKPVKYQRFCVISMLTPNCFPETKRKEYKEQKILGVKVRGVCETYEEAKERAENLQKHDKYHNIFVGEIGKWLPFDVDISGLDTQDDPVYREKSLNTYMKAYKECLEDDSKDQKERKNTSLEGMNVVTGKTGLPELDGDKNQSQENEPEEQSEQSEQSEETQGTEFANQKSVENKMASTVNERNQLQEQVEKSNEELTNLKSQLDDLKNMFTDLNK